ERFAEEDKKRKDEVDARNNAENLVYQTEKSLGELGDKVSAAEKAPIEEQLTKLKETLKGNDIEAIKADAEELTKRFYAIAEKLYAQAAPQGGEQQNGGNADGAVDADFEVVDDDK
ncbi:MAG: Hsp70 family protein, partial [Clostridia bacterium]|nr:Hsp70 family protein [Clostridia bacterium]